MWTYKNTDELYHHGILGMKWGVRRYQNKDGSYTSAGRKRYISDKTKGITDKTKRRKVAIEAGKKYDKVKTKQDKLINDNNDRVKTYGVKQVKRSNTIRAVLNTYSTYKLMQAVTKIGGNACRTYKNTGQYGKAKLAASAALAGIGTLAVASIRNNAAYAKDNRLADQYEERKAAAKKKKK